MNRNVLSTLAVIVLAALGAYLSSIYFFEDLDLAGPRSARKHPICQREQQVVLPAPELEEEDVKEEESPAKTAPSHSLSGPKELVKEIEAQLSGRVTQGRVSGYVLDSQGQPVKDVVVSIHEDLSEYTPLRRFQGSSVHDLTSDVNGAFESPGLKAGRYLISHFKLGFRKGEDRTVVVRSGETVDIEMEMKAAFQLFLTVTDEAGALLENASAVIQEDELESSIVSPNETGLTVKGAALAFQNIRSPKNRVIIDAPGYAGRLLQVRFSDENPVVNEVVQLRRAASITGRLVDKTNREPVANSTVFVLAEDGDIFYSASEADGFFQSSTSEGRPIQVVVMARDFQIRKIDHVVARGSLDLGVITLSPLAEVQIRVIDELGAPVPLTSLYFEQTAPPQKRRLMDVAFRAVWTKGSYRQSSMYTDKDGRALFQGLEMGHFRVYAFKEKFSLSFLSGVSLREDARNVFTLIMVKSQSKLQLSWQNEAGDALKKVRVEIRRLGFDALSGSAVTDEEGRCQWPSLAPGQYEVLSVFGEQRVKKVIEIVENESLDLEWTR